MRGANSTYWGNISEGFKSLKLGLTITWRHFMLSLMGKKRPAIGTASKNYFDHDKGIFTLEYPSTSMPVPDNGRYRLDNEIEDCIVCDKCAKVCPVNCIDIEAVKSTEEIRKASDGSSVRLHAAKFDIDMAKCCFCGLCTTVCPTECLTMTKSYDFSEYDITKMVYEFSDMTPESVEEKKKEFEVNQLAKQKAREAKTPASAAASPGAKPSIKPAMPKIAGAGKPAIKPAVSKPKVPGAKPVIPKPTTKEGGGDDEPKSSTPKPIIKPSIPKPGGVLKPKIASTIKTESEGGEQKKVLKPVMKPKVTGTQSTLKPKIPGVKKAAPTEQNTDSEKAKQVLKPVIKPKQATTSSPLKPKIPGSKKGSEEAGKKNQVLKPIIKPKPKTDEGN